MSNFQNLKAMWENKAKQSSNNVPPPPVIKQPQRKSNIPKEQTKTKQQDKPISQTKPQQTNQIKETEPIKHNQQKKNDIISMILQPKQQPQNDQETQKRNKTVGNLKNQFENVLKFATTPQMVQHSKMNAPPDKQLEIHSIRNPKDIQPIEGRQRNPSFNQKKAMLQKMYQNRQTMPVNPTTNFHKSFIPKPQIKSTIPPQVQHYQTGQIQQPHIQVRKQAHIPKITFVHHNSVPQPIENVPTNNTEILIQNRARFIVNNVFPQQKIGNLPPRMPTNLHINCNQPPISQQIPSNLNQGDYSATRRKKAKPNLGDFSDC